MSCKFVFLCGIIYLCVIQSQAAGLRKVRQLLSYDNSCYFEHYGRPLSEAQWIEGVDIDYSILDVERSFTKLYTANSRNIRKITNITVNGKSQKKENYVDILLVRGKDNDLEFIMTLGTGFDRYEDFESSIAMKINVTFLCENGDYKNLQIRQKILDTNNHDPRLRDFEFIVPEDLGANYLIGEVSARDVDLTNSYISFNFRSTGSNVEGDYALLGSYQDKDDPKKFHALLVTTRNHSLYYNQTINIYAQDSGKPSRTASAYVRLIPVSVTTTTLPTTLATEPTSTPSEQESPATPPFEGQIP